MRFWNEISDRLAGLTGSATPEETRQALNEFDVRDIQAVRVSENTGGGGGGDVPFVGVDPPPDPTDGMLWWDPDDDTAVTGGVVPFKVVRVPIAFSTPGLTFPDGPLDIYTPTDGDMIMGIYVSVPATAWNGTTPTLSVGPPGDLGHYAVTTLAGIDQQTFSGDTTVPLYDGAAVLAQLNSEILHADPIQALIDDGASGDPGSTEGEGVIVLFIIPAAS